jgi:arylsulfatase A-like enzyme
VPKKPNILLLFNDHQAYYRHGWDGGVRPQRPNFARVAARGVEFSRAYSPCPLCTPARRSLWTGLYPHNHRFYTLGSDPENAPEDFVFRHLTERGYSLHYYGKWHAGPGTAADYGCDGFSLPHYGNPYTAPEYKRYCAQRGLPEASFDVKATFYEGPASRRPPLGPGYQCTWDALISHSAAVLETPDDTHEAFFLANLACEKLEQLAQEDAERPFFLTVHFWGPHMPYWPSQRFVDMYDATAIQPYGSFDDSLEGRPAVYWTETNHPISENRRLISPNPVPWETWQVFLQHSYAQSTMVDAAGGRVLDKLEEVGLGDDTLIVWTTDHGDALASHGGHFDKNAYLTEEVLRVPMAAAWPGRIPAGQERRELVSLIDVPPTLLDAAGTGFEGRIDGASMLPMLMQERNEWRQTLVCETYGHHGEKVIGRAVVGERFKYDVYRYLDSDEVEHELLDLRDDPYELANVVDRSDLGQTVSGLRRALQQHRTATGDPVEW